MKLLYVILLLPLAASSQKTLVNEYDKFIKQRRIEIEPLTILSAANAKVTLAFNAVGNGLYLLLSGTGWGSSTVDAGQEVIFLFSNDSTITGKSTGLQTYEVTVTGNRYKHKYVVSYADLEAMSKYELVGIRKYSFNDHSDMKISKDCAARLKKSSALFMRELTKSIVKAPPQNSMATTGKQAKDTVTLQIVRVEEVPAQPINAAIKLKADSIIAGPAIATTTGLQKAATKAMFPGGDSALIKFLKANLLCPEDLENGEKRQVVASFEVNTDGRIANFRIVQSAGILYDQEVLRVLRRMPKWVPGWRDGIPAFELITQRITFTR